MNTEHKRIENGMQCKICSDNANGELSSFKEKWQPEFLSSYLKETVEQYIEVYDWIFTSALFFDIF